MSIEALVVVGCTLQSPGPVKLDRNVQVALSNISFPWTIYEAIQRILSSPSVGNNLESKQIQYYTQMLPFKIFPFQEHRLHKKQYTKQTKKISIVSIKAILKILPKTTCKRQR